MCNFGNLTSTRTVPYQTRPPHAESCMRQNTTLVAVALGRRFYLLPLSTSQVKSCSGLFWLCPVFWPRERARVSPFPSPSPSPPYRTSENPQTPSACSPRPVVHPHASNESSDFSRVSIFFHSPHNWSVHMNEQKRGKREISTACFSSDNRRRNLVNNSRASVMLHCMIHFV